MLGRTGVAHYGRRCSWAHSEGHIGVAHWEEVLMGPFRGGTHNLQLFFFDSFYVNKEGLYYRFGKIYILVGCVLSISKFSIVYKN